MTDKDVEWLAHDGGKCPVNEGELVTVRLRDGKQGTRFAYSLFWEHDGREDDIIAYSKGSV